MNKNLLLTIWMFFLFILIPVLGPTGELSWYFIPREILFIISALAVIAVKVCTSRKSLYLSFSKNELLVWILFLLSALLSNINASYHFPSLHGFIVYAAIGITIMYFRKISDSDQFTKTYSFIAIGGSLLISIILLFVFAFSVFDNILFADRAKITFSSLDIFGNREYLSATIGISFVIFFFSRIKHNGAGYIIYCITGFTLFLLNVRGVILAVIGALLITKVITAESPAKRWYMTIGILVVSTIPCILLTLSLLHYTIPLVRLHTISGRVILWFMSIPMIVDSFGAGIGMGNIEFHVIPSLVSLFSNDYFSSFSSSASMVRRIHNEYLDFIVEGGLLLGACLAFILMMIFKRIRKIPSSSVCDNSSAIAGVVFILLLSLWSLPLHNIQVLFLGGCCIAQLLGNRFTHSNPLFSVALKTTVSQIVCVIAVVCSIFYFCIIYRANKNHAAAIRSLTNHSYANAIALIDKIPKPIRSSDQIYTGIVAKASLGQLNNAMRDCEMLFIKGPTIDIMKVYGSLLFDTKEFSKAQGIYRTLTQAFPEQITPKYMLGKIALEKGNLLEAQKLFTLVLTKKPKSIKAQSERAGAEEYLRKIDTMQKGLNPEKIR